MTDQERGRFLSLCPRRLLRWELNSERHAVLFRPRFGSGRLARKMEGLLGIPEYRIRLDRRGPAVWRSMDGATPLSVTLEILRRELGEDQKQAIDRLKRFVDQMLRSRLIEVS